jgi:hypothetical protein
MVELAIVMTLALAMSIAVFELGRGFSTYIDLVPAAREGARVAISVDNQNTPGTLTQIRAAVENAALPLTVPDGNVTITCPYNGSSQKVQVTVTAPFTTIVPLFDQYIGGGTGTIDLVRSNVAPVPRCPA